MEQNIQIKIKNFTDLKVWQESHKLVLQTYKITKKFPKGEIYSLVDQIRRAATSVTSNIAEGFGRQSYKEKIQFYYLAQGSLTEVEDQLIIARDVNYITTWEYNELIGQATLAHKLLSGIIKKSKSYLLK